MEKHVCCDELAHTCTSILPLDHQFQPVADIVTLTLTLTLTRRYTQGLQQFTGTEKFVQAVATLKHCTVLVFTMDSAVLGLAALGCECCMVLVSRRNFALECAIGSHACSLEAILHACDQWHSSRVSTTSYQLTLYIVSHR